MPRDAPPKFWAQHYLPILRWIRHYKVKEYVVPDLLAGFTVGVMAVPQAMSYALVAGLPPSYGLYSSFYPMLIYAIFGTSPHLITGPTAVVSLLTREAVPKTLHGNPVEEFTTDWCNLAFSLAFFVAALQIVMGLLRVGFVVNFISEPVIVAFTTGAAFLIASTQFGSLLGTPRCSASGNGSCTFVQEVINVFKNIKHVNGFTVIVSITSMLVLLAFIKLRRCLPPKLRILGNLGPLLLVIAYCTVDFLFGTKGGLEGKGVAVIGDVPSGLASPSDFFGVVNQNNVGGLLQGALGISLVGFMETVAMASQVDRKYAHGNALDSSQELFSLGMMNFVGSMFQCYPVAGSFSRTAVNADCGARSSFSSLFASLFVLLSLYVVTPALKYIPKAVLSAIVILSIINLIDFKRAVHFYKVQWRDFIVYCAVFIVSLTVNSEIAIALGVMLSWVLSLAVPYAQSVPVHVLKVRQQQVTSRGSTPHSPVVLGSASPRRSTSISTKKQWVMTDVANSPQRSLELADAPLTPAHVIAVIDFRYSLMFSISDKLKSTVGEVFTLYSPRVIVLNIQDTITLDATGMDTLATVHADCMYRRVELYVAGLSPELTKHFLAAFPDALNETDTAEHRRIADIALRRRLDARPPFMRFATGMLESPMVDRSNLPGSLTYTSYDVFYNDEEEDEGESGDKDTVDLQPLRLPPLQNSPPAATITAARDAGQEHERHDDLRAPIVAAASDDADDYCKNIRLFTDSMRAVSCAFISLQKSSSIVDANARVARAGQIGYNVLLVPESSLVKYYRELGMPRSPRVTIDAQSSPDQATGLSSASLTRGTPVPMEEQFTELASGDAKEESGEESVSLSQGIPQVCGSRICSSIVGAGGRSTILVPAPRTWLNPVINERSPQIV